MNIDLQLYSVNISAWVKQIFIRIGGCLTAKIPMIPGYLHLMFCFESESPSGGNDILYVQQKNWWSWFWMLTLYFSDA